MKYILILLFIPTMAYSQSSAVLHNPTTTVTDSNGRTIMTSEEKTDYVGNKTTVIYDSNGHVVGTVYEKKPVEYNYPQNNYSQTQSQMSYTPGRHEYYMRQHPKSRSTYSMEDEFRKEHPEYLYIKLKHAFKIEKTLSEMEDKGATYEEVHKKKVKLIKMYLKRDARF